MYPTTSLQPGQTGPDVLKLQQYLVSQGYLTQAQMNTGPGIYGPATTAAVKSLQQTLGVDNSSGPGYWGPKTLAAVTGTKAPTTTTTTNPTTTASLQKAALGAVADVAANAAAIGKPPVSFAEALKIAANDPNIVARYSDMLKIDKQAFTDTLSQLQLSTSQDAMAHQMQFEKDRKDLAEQSAAAGQAYSGFRGKAQENLGKTESAIVQSSRAKTAQQLNDLTRSFEAKYGTSNTPNASVSYTDPFASSATTLSGQMGNTISTRTEFGNTLGGITGSVAPEKSADINASALNSYQTAQFPQV